MEHGEWKIGNGKFIFGKEFNDYYVVEKFISGDYRYPRFLSKGFRGKFNIRE